MNVVGAVADFPSTHPLADRFVAVPRQPPAFVLPRFARRARPERRPPLPAGALWGPFLHIWHVGPVRHLPHLAPPRADAIRRQFGKAARTAPPVTAFAGGLRGLPFANPPRVFDEVGVLRPFLAGVAVVRPVPCQHRATMRHHLALAERAHRTRARVGAARQHGFRIDRYFHVCLPLLNSATNRALTPHPTPRDTPRPPNHPAACGTPSAPGRGQAKTAGSTPPTAPCPRPESRRTAPWSTSPTSV